jgi:hypothetical protein
MATLQLRGCYGLREGLPSGLLDDNVLVGVYFLQRGL